MANGLLGGGPPDLSGVGNAATAPKSDTGGGQQLMDFTVKRGDDGGITVCESYVRTPPAGRRVGASFPQSGRYTETPFGSDEADAASSKVTALLGKLGVSAGAAPADDEMLEPPPAAAAVRGPRGGGVAVARPQPPLPPMGGGGY